MQSCVLIAPASERDSANAIAESIGWGPDNFGVALTDDEAPTHYGLHTWIETVPDAFAAVPGLIASIRADMRGHFAEVCEGAGLAPIQATD
jgi:hypothetical protein